MKIFWATLGGFALQILTTILLVVIVGWGLSVAVPAAWPALGFTFSNAVGLSAVLFIVRAIFK